MPSVSNLDRRSNAKRNVPIGQWHAVHALESGSVILEVKDGPYEPIGPEDILEL